MKFRVFPVGIVFIIFYNILSLVALGLVIFTPSVKETWLWVLSTLMFIVLPLILSIYILSFSLDLIIINDEGIKKYHYGKLKKTIRWNEIKTLSCTDKNLFNGWCYISNECKNYNYHTITKMRLDRSVIYFHLSEKAIKALSIYCPNKDIIEKAFNNQRIEVKI